MSIWINGHFCSNAIKNSYFCFWYFSQYKQSKRVLLGVQYLVIWTVKARQVSVTAKSLLHAENWGFMNLSLNFSLQFHFLTWKVTDLLLLPVFEIPVFNITQITASRRETMKMWGCDSSLTLTQSRWCSWIFLSHLWLLSYGSHTLLQHPNYVISIDLSLTLTQLQSQGLNQNEDEDGFQCEGVK